MRHKFQRTLAATLILVSCAFAQQPAAPRPTAEPDAERLRAHVAHLASDRLEGRKTGTPGAEEAARYVAAQLAAFGLKPAPPAPSGHVHGGTDAGYLRAFPYVAGVEPGRNNAMTLATRPAAAAAGADASAPAATLDLRLGDDWMPLGFSANARVESAPVVFVGHAIKAAESGHDDFAGARAEGRVALAFAATPDADNPHARLARFSDLRLRAASARAAGARALVLIAREDNFREDRLSRLSFDNAGGDAGLPVAVISRQAASRVLGVEGLAPLAELEGALRRRAAETSAAAGHNAVAHAVPDGVALTVSTDVVRKQAPAFNVVGVLEGSDPRLKDEVIVVGAHYDHLGRGGRGSRAEREGDVHHGADDNASGVAGMLELARLFAADRQRMRRTVVFIAFGGEEEGLLGSSHYVNNPAFPLAQTVAMINLDMVGRLKDERLMVGGVGTASEWRAALERANTELDMKVNAAGAAAGDVGGGTPAVVGADGRVIATTVVRRRFALALNEDGFGPSDHSSFYGKQVPVLFFFTGTHEDYHRPTDTAERINYDGLARVTSFVRRVVYGLQESDPRPTFAAARVEQTARSTGFRVYLGTVPSYAESADGMKLEGVQEGSPAAAAGLKAGDVIVKLSGRDVRNVYDYTQALSEMKAGQEYEVEVTRGAERLKMKITPAARK